MGFAADIAILLDRIDSELGSERHPASGVFAKVMAAACQRLPALSRTDKAGRLAHLLDAGAWTEAALALIELELPGWTVRRLIYENGEWFCSLSRQPNVPLTLDDSV